MSSQVLFTILVLAVALQRLWELHVSKEHERALKAEGAIEHAPQQMPFMTALHTLWLVAMLAEVWLLDAPYDKRLATASFVLFMIGQVLRLSAMQTLGRRWTVKIIVPTNAEPSVSTGIYRYLRHPNYLGVMLEIFALPLAHGAYVTALLFSVANGILMMYRISAEELALGGNSDYGERFRGRPRLLPALFRR